MSTDNTVIRYPAPVLPMPPSCSRPESEAAVLELFARAEQAISSGEDTANSFSIAELITGTGLDRCTVINACAYLSDGWARDDNAPGHEARLKPVLAPVGNSGDSGIHYTLNAVTAVTESPCPNALPPIFENFPAELTERAQWVVWKYVWRKDAKDASNSKWTKPPFNARTGRGAKSNDAFTWSTFAQARATYDRGGWDGVGFMLHLDAAIVGIDFDKCAPGGELNDDTARMIAALDTYTEWSPSGVGIRCFALGALPVGHGSRNAKREIEIYDSVRFLTVTGHRLVSAPKAINVRTEAMAAFLAEVFPPEPPRERSQAQMTRPVDQSSADLLEVAFRSKNGAKIRALYGGDTSGYPGASEADMAFCSLLAFYTGGDYTLLDGWYRASGLMRDKWDEKHYAGGVTYGQKHVQKAVDVQATKGFWTPPAHRGATQAKGKQQPEGAVALGASESSSLREVYKLTDLGNAERLVDAHCANYRFDHDLKAWFRFDGKHWQIDGTGSVLETAKQTIRAIYVEASAELDDERRTALIRHATASEKVGRITAMVELSKTVPSIAVQQRAWDADPMEFNCQNGTVDLRTGELRPHSANDLITKIAPVVYDPTATAPTWEKCLARWQPDDEVRQFLARAAGYSLTGNIGEETAFFTYGLGRNGKSKFTGALAYIMGEYATRVSIEALMDSRCAGAATPDLVPLVGARLVVASEVHEGKRLNESYIKDLTGGDAITARANYGAVFVFHPSFKLWLYGNHKPDIRGTDDGIWSRLPLIPFTVTIPVEERDPELSAKLEAEASGILAWAVRGCLEWQKMRLAPPEAVLLATAEYRKQQDPTTNFFTDRCVVDADDNALFTASASLYKSYEEWAEGEGERRLLNTKTFGERLTRLGLKSKERRIAGKVTRCWVGIGLLPSIPRCPSASCNGCNACNGISENSDNACTRGEITETALQPLQPLQNLAFTEEGIEEEEEEHI